MMYEDMPIKIYSIVQTTGKRAAGGLKDGLLNEVYDIFPLKKEDKTPAANGIKRAVMKSDLCMVFMITDNLSNRIQLIVCEGTGGYAVISRAISL